MKKLITLLLAVAVVGCADPAFQQYVQQRQGVIDSMPNGRNKYYAQLTLDQQILADKQRQQQQAAAAALAIAGGVAVGLSAAAAARTPYYYPYPYCYRPWWAGY